MERRTWIGSPPHSTPVDVVKRLADCVEESDEMKSREHLQGYKDILNTELCDGAVRNILEELCVEIMPDLLENKHNVLMHHRQDYQQQQEEGGE